MIGPPREARIETTTVCNANCTICPREKLTRPRTTMGFDHFNYLAKQIKEMGIFHMGLFGYGEPLMDPGIAKKIKLCSLMGMDTTITTNASLLTPIKTQELIEAQLTEIRFSCHGFGCDYESIHNLSWDNTMYNIAEFVETAHNIVTNVSVIPMNGETVEEIKRFWEPIVDYIEIWRPHNWTDGRKFRRVNGKKKTCGRPQSGPIQINADGKMMVCCFDFDAKLTIGDTYEQTIQEILDGDELGYIKAKHETDLEGLVCESCDQLNTKDFPLLYSNRDMEVGKTSTFKFSIGD